MEYIKVDQVPPNFMKVVPSNDGPDYSQLTKPKPSPGLGQAVPIKIRLRRPPRPK